MDDITRRTGVPADPPDVVFRRARPASSDRAGKVPAGGCRHLMTAADGWVAINPARPDDEAAQPALSARSGRSGRSGLLVDTSADPVTGLCAAPANALPPRPATSC
ncbi:hypothetical protein [Streptomyces sp. NPDC008092]|uniref:hypothetical protein n=1 Tax=Streptomyces sp. NPDC008092 TaxID=3364808 RepID=UPI0036EEB403